MKPKLLRTKTCWRVRVRGVRLYIYEGDYFQVRGYRYKTNTYYNVDEEKIHSIRKKTRKFIKINSITTMEEFKELKELFKLQVLN